MIQLPAPGERHLRYVGDRIAIELRLADGPPLPAGWRALLRTNIGQARVLRSEVVRAPAGRLPLAGASWQDLPMAVSGGCWRIELPLAEVGYFQAKAYAVDPDGFQHWPDGLNLGITVQPNAYRTANTIYCAFPRMFGPNKARVQTEEPALEARLKALDAAGFTVIPPSGKLRDLIRELPHIFGVLGCRILHLLPVSPTPTTMAKFGRFGSPYAVQDLTGIDSALVEFDRETTGVDQFRELAFAVHARGGRLFLDLVINHTGWGSTLQEVHPEWFLRNADEQFVSPGAWGTTWEDLVELDHSHVGLWEHLSEVLLTWCRRGVDGFRCDAGYKVPMPAWRYIAARVREEFPETVFLLEGLGGAWEATESLLTDGGMQWAYSELFQNYEPMQVSGYLDHSVRQSARVGVLVHYSETHDNPRLAARGRAWSLFRNRLCALTSASGAYGFTCGVEWLATEKVLVHGARGLAWGAKEHLIDELGLLNRLLAEHPCFFDGARVTRLSMPDAPGLVLRRDAANGLDRLWVVANLDAEKPCRVVLGAGAGQEKLDLRVDLLGQPLPRMVAAAAGGGLQIELGSLACYCLAERAEPLGLTGEAYRRQQVLRAWVQRVLCHVFPLDEVVRLDVTTLAAAAEANPQAFLAATLAPDAHAAVAAFAKRAPASELRPRAAAEPRTAAGCDVTDASDDFPRVVVWRRADLSRIALVPPGCWFCVLDDARFFATLSEAGGELPQRVESIATRAGQVACFVPRSEPTEAVLELERYVEDLPRVTGRVRFLSQRPLGQSQELDGVIDGRVLFANGRGGMARLAVDLGAIRSKYDCLLAANLHGEVPVDRHVFGKRVRVWVNADGFISPLGRDNLVSFAPGPPARWRFLASAGAGRGVEIELVADMIEGRNTTVLRFARPARPPAFGSELPAACDVRLTARVDIEDRNFHWETQRNGGADHHFMVHLRVLSDRPGFAFSPAADRGLWVYADAGRYHPQAEWCENLPHPVEENRGQTPRGDAFSPGWFDLPLERGAEVTLVATAESDEAARIGAFDEVRAQSVEAAVQRAAIAGNDVFGRQLAVAAQQFVVRRGAGRTVIAGYPWFLDWGRDTLICARGLLAAGMVEEVRDLLRTFGRFEDRGTLPNAIHGLDASNRDTSDAPLWYAVVCEETAERCGAGLYDEVVDGRGRRVRDILQAIAAGYFNGTPNGICCDARSGLVWSPKHFTWMDTNHPAGTPREGYPVEIQVLWIRLLQLLVRLGAGGPAAGVTWTALAERALESLEELFWLSEPEYLADCLVAAPGEPARAARVDGALRSNALLAVSLGLLAGARARRCVLAAQQHLVVPGALRSLAPLPVTLPLPIYSHEGQLLNHPLEPYWGRYEGDEDTRRKPAYHNGTAWTWTFPHFCEAVARAWEFRPDALRAARAYLLSSEALVYAGCLGQLPEIVDGDVPHAERGCDAQAWGVTEALRVWRLLNAGEPGAKSDAGSVPGGARG
jgi:predicted glycogen debranching enzyme